MLLCCSNNRKKNIKACVLFMAVAPVATALAAPAKQPAVSLQVFHPPQTPTEMFEELSLRCKDLGIESFDVYGDYHLGEFVSILCWFEMSQLPQLCTVSFYSAELTPRALFTFICY